MFRNKIDMGTRNHSAAGRGKIRAAEKEGDGYDRRKGGVL